MAQLGSAESSRCIVARCTPSRCPAAAALRSRRSSVTRSSCGVMADSYVKSQHATASRTARYLRQCRTMRHCRLRRTPMLLKDLARWVHRSTKARPNSKQSSPLQRKLFSWGAATVCTSPCKSVFRRGLKEMNFHFAHESSNPICPAMQSVSATCQGAIRYHPSIGRRRSHGGLCPPCLLDSVPTYYEWTHADKNWAVRDWHWTFMAQPEPF